MADPAAEPVVAAEPRHLEMPPDVAAPGDNKVVIDGRTFTWVRRLGEIVALSLRCPTCNVEKDLHYKNSGMADAEAVQRLVNWSNRCQPNHKHFGGRLLKDCK